MILVNKNGVSFFQFESLNRYPTICHGVFTRHCGHSTGPFQSLNVGFGLGDGADNVRANRQRICRALGAQELVFAEQVHGDDVIVLNSQNSGPEMSSAGGTGVGDALVADVGGKFLVIQLADCQSILLYDPIRQVIANVHCGWRGSIRNIVGRTVRVMNKCFRCNSADMIAGIGPSLGPCCAEFVNYRDEIPEELWRYKSAADHFDFWALSRDQLISAGVLRAHIEAAGMCTKCNTGTFFSYRGEGQTGRFASVIGINNAGAIGAQDRSRQGFED